MSIKTLRKRIALVAVSALGAGLMSVVAVPSAYAANGDVNVSLISSITGSAVSTGTDETAHRQVGWVSATNTAATLTTTLMTLNGGDAQTGVCLSTCSLPFEIDNTDDAVGYSVVVVNGTLSGIDETGVGGETVVSGDRRTAVYDLVAGTTNGSLIGTVTASSGATSMTISWFRGASIEGLTTATSGTLLGTLTVTIAPANTSGTYSAANSTITTQIAYAPGSTASGLLTYDNSSKISNGYRGAIYVKLADPYTAAITTGTVTVSATNGAYVNIVDTIPAAGHDYAASSAFDSETDGLTGGDAYVTVTQPVANTAGSTTVTIALNGEVIATKTLNWVGDIASIAIDTVNSNAIFRNGATNEFAGGRQGLIYVVKDAAGNVVELDDTSSSNDNGPTMTGQTGSMVGASVTATMSTTTGVLQTKAAGYGTTTVNVPSSALTGAGSFKLRVKNASGGNVDSAEYKVTVSEETLDSFAVSWDATTYAPGNLATLTITGKDSKGNTIADGHPLTGLTLSVATGLTAVGTACAATSTFSAGKVTCKYSAGNTDGAYSYSIDMDTGTAQAASVGAVKVVTSGVVSNTQVLEAIVKLIASINKQIRALQKSLRR